MSWDTIKTQLDSLKANLATQTTAASAETADSAKATDVAAVKLACEALIGQAQDLQRMVEEKREPSALEVLETKLDAIRADKEHKEIEERDKDGFIIKVTFESSKSATKIVQTWLYSDTTINRRGAGASLKEVDAVTGEEVG